MKTLNHKFVEYAPEILEEGVLYVSIEHCTAIHKCVCGCGNEVVTPLSPAGWKLTFDGKTITLYPSIGNWNFPCKSHYFITNNKINHARRWTDSEIKKVKRSDSQNWEDYYKNKNS
jgi:hypothetical protein